MAYRSFTPEDAYLLHDHLEGVAAAAYQMRTARLNSGDKPEDTGHTALLNRLRRITDFAGTMQALELTILLKVSKARAWCQRLSARELNLSPVIPLFIGTTGLLEDKLAGAGEVGRIRFHGENDTLNFLISRGFVLPGTRALDMIETIEPCETIRLLGELPLSPLADTCATFSDVLDINFRLYRDDDVTASVDRDAETLRADEALVEGDSVAASEDTGGEEPDDGMILVGVSELDEVSVAGDRDAGDRDADDRDQEAISDHTDDLDDKAETSANDASIEDDTATAQPLPMKPSLRERLARVES